MDKVCQLKKPNSENNAFAESLYFVLSRELFRKGLFDKSWAARQSISDGSPHKCCFFVFCRLKADVFTSRDQCQRSKRKVPFLINLLRVYKDNSISFLILQTCHTSLSPNNSSEREGSSVIRSSVDLFQVQ